MKFVSAAGKIPVEIKFGGRKLLPVVTLNRIATIIKFRVFNNGFETEEIWSLAKISTSVFF